jgi:membrane-associated protease RseP (regulator of RpoE activity)
MPMQLVYPATLLGAALLLTLMVLTTVMDIQRLFNWL